MPLLTRYGLLYQNEQPVLSISAQVSLENLRKTVHESETKLQKYLDGLGECLTDVPFVVYHNSDLGNLDIEICAPTRKPLKGKGEIKFSSIEAGWVITCVFLGGDLERKRMYDEMMEWLPANGYTYTGITYEYFYTKKDLPEEMTVSKVMRTVKNPR